MAREPRLICASGDLADGGRGVRFDWPPAGGDGKGFAVRHAGTVRAYVNRCPHQGTELDWEPGEFFEDTGLYLVCATHGATFDPASGLCVAGPCKGARLEAIAVSEGLGRVTIDDEGREPDRGEASPTSA